jgi:putative pyruvate formate lyase activating enzyme
VNRRAFLRTCAALTVAGAAPALACCRRKSPPPAPSAPVPEKLEASYLALHGSGELARRGEALWDMMTSCSLCPRRCGARRIDGEKGMCRASSTLEISGFNPHFGEEDPLVGTGGSGTIFLSNCSLSCVFCINWQTSQGGDGVVRSVDDLADMMLSLQDTGCHNVNVVTPTHYSAHIVRALDRAASKGLTVPVVWNTCGWERIEVLQILDGVVDIYLPDYKYSDGKMAAKYSHADENYPEVTQAALVEMNRQVGVARPPASGIMQRGLMIRHLVMPGGVSGSAEVMRWIGDNLPRDTYVNIMSQYRPMHLAHDHEEIARPITRDEYHVAVQAARDAGLTNLEIQGYPP